MKPHIDLLRAIGSEFAARKLRSIMLTFGLASVLIGTAAIWLTTLSVWWWLLAVPVLMIIFIGVILLFIVRMALVNLRPQMTKIQKKAVSDFVNKLENTADALQTPLFIIVYRVVRDVMWPRPKAYIVTVVEDSRTLTQDFRDLQKLFSA